MEIDRGLDRDEIIHFTQPHRGFRTIDNPIVVMGGSSSLDLFIYHEQNPDPFKME